MLVLDRKTQQGLWIDERIFVKILSIGRQRVKLGIAAPSDLSIARDELRPPQDSESFAGREPYGGRKEHRPDGTGAAESLRESRARYRALVEQIPAITYVAPADQPSATVYISPQIESLLGVSPSEWLADPDAFVKHLHPDDRERVLAEAARSGERGEPFASEYRLVARDGRVLWFRDEALLVRDEAGKPLLFQGVMLDITEGKQAEDALRKSDQVNRALLNAIPDLMFRVSTDGTFLDFKPAKGVEPFVRPTEFLGKTVSAVLPADVAEPAMRLVREALRTGETQTFEYQLPIDGGLRDYEARAAVCGEDEAVVIVRDITEQREAEETLQRAREELEERVERGMRRGNLYGLTFRELAVLHLVAAGKLDKEIGRELGISPRTAEKHVENILSKMKAISRTDAGVRALKEGLVT